jgi:hypothetical protein
MADALRNAESVALAGQTPSAVFDDDATTSLPLPPRALVDVRFREATRASHYTITSGGAPLGGLGWSLQGRNKTGAWTTLDQRRAEDFQWTRQLRPFRIGKPGNYREYRLQFTNGQVIDIAELELLAARP